MITQERLKECLSYNPDTGSFTWIIVKRNVITGSIAGCTFKASSKTYRKIRIDWNYYTSHRLVFLYMTGSWPKNEVDHIDGDGTNNSWGNLRCVTRLENCKNMRLQSNNTSGVPGVRRHRKNWQTWIKVNGENIYLGTYRDKFESICARKSAENKYNFHENHGTVRPL